MSETTVSVTPNLSYRYNHKGAWLSSRLKPPVNKPVFSIAGYNGGPIVEQVLLKMGWIKAFDKNCEDFNLKWTEVVTQVNFYRVKPNQLVNHIPNCGILTNKLGLLLSLRGYEKYCKSIDRQKKLHMNDFIPTTFVIDDLNERMEFYRQFEENDIWICKPVGSNQGKGITLIRNIDKFKADMLERENTVKQLYTVQARIVQKYITNPLLIYSKKFDLRSYMLIASTVPYVVLFCPGYVRLSMNAYNNNDENLITHLTNQFIQKKSPKYTLYKEDTVMSMEGFNEYFNKNCRNLKNFKENWVLNELVETMKDIVHHVFKAIKQRLANSTAFFELYGLDFMIDEDLKVWLIEANSNPSMSLQCQVLRQIIPNVVEESLKLALECFEKNQINKSIIPLENMKIFHLVYSEEGPVTKSRRNGITSMKSWTAPRYYYSSQQDNWLPDHRTDSSVSSVGGPNSTDSIRSRLTRNSVPHRFPINEKYFERYQHLYNPQKKIPNSPVTLPDPIRRGTGPTYRSMMTSSTIINAAGTRNQPSTSIKTNRSLTSPRTTTTTATQPTTQPSQLSSSTPELTPNDLLNNLGDTKTTSQSSQKSAITNTATQTYLSTLLNKQKQIIENKQDNIKPSIILTNNIKETITTEQNTATQNKIKEILKQNRA